MDNAFHRINGNVLLLYYRIMETAKGISIAEVIIPFTIILFVIATGVVLLYQNFQKNLYQHQLDKAAIKVLQKEELLGNSILVQEAERKRIASDLHDELGAVISIIRMHLSVILLKEKKSDNAALTESIQNLINLSETAIHSVRNISHRLMPPQLETFGLIKTLHTFAETINRSEHIFLTVDVKTSFPQLDWMANLGLYRILMELINNTIKHANATTIVIAMECLDDSIQLTYTDNGKGLPGDAISATGMGFKNIEARTQALKGRFRLITTTPGKGFKATIEIPA